MTALFGPQAKRRLKKARQAAIRQAAVLLADRAIEVSGETAEAIAIWLESLGGVRDRVLAKKIRTGDWLEIVDAKGGRG